MGRLFWKIFFWFWLAMVLLVLGVGFGVTHFSDEEEFPEKLRRGNPLHFLVAREQARVAANLRRNGLEKAQDIAGEIASQRPFSLQIIEVNTHETSPPTQTSQDDTFFLSFRSHRVTLNDGRKYEIRTEPKWIMKTVYFFSKNLGIPLFLLVRVPELFFAKIGIAIMISGLVCFWLAWYITRPIKRLSEAARQIASGDLSARINYSAKHWQDEITVLNHDFNQMTEQLQVLMSAQQRLLNDVSHELRSPLTRLPLAVALTRQNADEKLEHMLDRVERESKNLDRLIDQLLTLSRLEAGSVYPLEAAINLKELLHVIVQDADFEAQESGRRVKLDVLSEPMVRGNRELLFRALENVIRNGVKYTAENTEVNVVLETQADDSSLATVTVIDAGPGLPPEHLQRIFESFVQVSENVEKRQTGYGLGLSIAHHVVQAHGGMIDAYNRKQGGLCVRFQLPILKEDAA